MARTGNDSWKSRVDRLENSVQESRGWSTRDTVRFLALSLCGEAGELANEIKKEWRSNGAVRWTPEEIEAYVNKVRFEIADVHMLLYRLAMNCNIDIDTACDDKLDEIKTRGVDWAAGLNG